MDRVRSHTKLSMSKHYFSQVTAFWKLFQHLVLGGLFFLGACSSQNPASSENVSKPVKESALSQKLAAGKSLYESNCASCHDSGSSGAPKHRDKEVWSNRTAAEKDVMIKKAIEGVDGKVGMMPPRGGNASLTDDDIKTVILYMTSKTDTSEENTSVESPL